MYIVSCCCFTEETTDLCVAPAWHSCVMATSRAGVVLVLALCHHHPRSQGQLSGSLFFSWRQSVCAVVVCDLIMCVQLNFAHKNASLNLACRKLVKPFWCILVCTADSIIFFLSISPNGLAFHHPHIYHSDSKIRPTVLAKWMEVLNFVTLPAYCLEQWAWFLCSRQ